MRTIKEKTCYVAPNLIREDKEMMGRTEEFRLPDGQVIQVGIDTLLIVDFAYQAEWDDLRFLVGERKILGPRNFVQP